MPWKAAPAAVLLFALTVLRFLGGTSATTEAKAAAGDGVDCEASWEEAAADGNTTLKQATSLTEKLEIDCACFVAGVLVATWKLLTSLLLPLWREGCCACLRGCREWCCVRLRCCQRRCFGSCCICFKRASRTGPAGQVPLLPDEPSQGRGGTPQGGLCSRMSLSSLMKGKPTGFKHYFRYMGTCCVTFLVLFAITQIVDQLFRVFRISVEEARQGAAQAAEGRRDVVAGWLLIPGSIFGHLTDDNMEGVFGWTFTVVYINGIVFLASTFFLERTTDQPAVHEKVSRTIWVHGLPVKDQRLNPLVREPFRLNWDELQRVENELGARFNDELTHRREIAEAGRLPGAGGAGAGGPCAGTLEPLEDDGEWVVDEWEAHLPHHERREPSEGWRTGNGVGAKGIFRDEDGRAVFVRKVRAASRIENVWVTPAVQSWRATSKRLEDTFKQQRIYQQWALVYRLPNKNGVWDSAWRRWYEFWSNAFRERVQKLEVELLRIRLKKIRMCGCAFVLFREVGDCRDLLGRAPQWWHCKQWLCFYNLLKFGHVPFTSVTLEYEPAPHPYDINWENMDTPRWWSELVFGFLTLVLIALLLASQTILVWILGNMPFGDGVTQHFASLIMLFINRTILPFPVEAIALAGKFRRKTEGELRQMHLNFWLLLINTIVVPLLGLQIVQQIPNQFQGDPLKFVRCVSFSLLKMPNMLFVGYLFDATFLTNLYQVLAGSLFELCGLVQRTFTAALPPDRSVVPPVAAERAKARPRCAASRPAEAQATGGLYSFGYYYAWTLSLVALALFSSCEVPASLLIAALCFCIKVVVDWCNFRNKVYEIGPEHEGVFIIWAVFYLRLCVSAWWLMIGLGIEQLCADHTRECPSWVGPACWAMIWLAGLVLVLSLFRVSYASAARRFFPGRLQAEAAHHGQSLSPAAQQEKISWDATPERLKTDSAVLDSRRRRRSLHSLLGAQPGRLAPPKAQWKHAHASVEEVMEAIQDRPSLEESVKRFLQEGSSVQDILQRVRRASYCKSHSSPASFCVPGPAHTLATRPTLTFASSSFTGVPGGLSPVTAALLSYRAAAGPAAAAIATAGGAEAAAGGGDGSGQAHAEV